MKRCTGSLSDLTSVCLGSLQDVVLARSQLQFPSEDLLMADEKGLRSTLSRSSPYDSVTSADRSSPGQRESVLEEATARQASFCGLPDGMPCHPSLHGNACRQPACKGVIHHARTQMGLLCCRNGEAKESNGVVKSQSRCAWDPLCRRVLLICKHDLQHRLIHTYSSL